MLSSLIAAVTLAGLAQPAGAWVWSYYDGDGSVVLAREIPDTSHLSAVLECTPGSGVARLTVYGPQERPAFVNVSVGDVSADMARVDGDGLAVRLRLDHPALQAFGSGQALTVTAGDGAVSLVAPAEPLMAAFRSACA